VSSLKKVNFSSVSIKGAFNYARARVLWHDGLLRVFTLDGLSLEIVALRPVKRHRYIMTWDVDTGKGDIVMRLKCVTCAGRKWWRLVAMPSDELWRLPA
jgi:hypothetical protein